MKWAILIPRFLPEVTGGNIVYVGRFSKALVKRGDIVHIFTTTLDSNLSACEEIAGVKIHRVLVSSGNAGSLRFSATRTITELFQRIDQKVKFHILNPHAPFQVDYKKIRNDIKIVYTLHAVITYEYLYDLNKIFSTMNLSRNSAKELLVFPLKLPVCYFREVMTLRKAQKIIVMSNYVKKTVTNYFPFIKTAKIYVSRIGINTADFKPIEDKNTIRTSLKLMDEEIIFFTVRRLVFRMGIENLIMALFLSL